jgi:hypothetical protein
VTSVKALFDLTWKKWLKQFNSVLLPVSVSHSLMWVSYEAEMNSVPSLLKQMSRTGILWPV